VIARIDATHTQLERYKRNWNATHLRYRSLARLVGMSGKNLAGARYIAVTAFGQCG